MRPLVCVELRAEDAVATTSGWRGVPEGRHEVRWTPSAPETLVAELQSMVGPVREILLALGPTLLHVARVQLPPSGDAAREQMIQLEPDRYFAHTGPLQTCLVPGTDLAFAADADWLERLVAAFERWAPVSRVEPSPLSVAQAMPGASGTWLLAGAGSAVVELSNGRLTGLLRQGSTARAVEPSTVATGLLRGRELPFDGTLMAAPRRQVLQRQRWQHAVAAGLAALVGLTLLASSVGGWRDRTLAALEQESRRLEAAAAPALAAQQVLAGLSRERALVDSVMRHRADPAAALAALGGLLPADAHLMLSRATGSTWQIDGTARDAAALVPLLDASPLLDNVRSLSASTRFRDGARSRETFSIALDAARTP